MRKTLTQILGEAQTKAVQEALKPHLRAAGVHNAERRIGKPRRFFENLRYRGTLQLRDFLATCVALDLDPAELITRALADEVGPVVGRPRIVTSAWRRIRDQGPGIGEQRLAELESLVQTRPKQARTALARQMRDASREQVPRVLGLCASAYRVQSDLPRAELVLREAYEIARSAELRAAEPELLIRMAYVALERERPVHALKSAQEATFGFTRLSDREGQGRGLQTAGIMRYYLGDFREALFDIQAAMAHLSDPRQLMAFHQIAAYCFAALDLEGDACREAAAARALADGAPEWMQGKLSWLEADLARGSARLDHLRRAKAALWPGRPADCALVTIELIAQALAVGDESLAEQAALGLCALVERTSSPRIEKAILRLVRNQGRLTPDLVAEIRRSLERSRERRLAALISAGF